MATTACGLKFYKNLLPGGGCPAIVKWPSKADQTVAVGDVILATSGYATIWTNSAHPEDIIGVCNKALVTGATTYTPMEIIPAFSWILWEVVSQDIAAAANRGEEYDLDGGTGVMELDIADTTDPCLRIFGPSPNATDADWGTSELVLAFFSKSMWAGT